MKTKPSKKLQKEIETAKKNTPHKIALKDFLEYLKPQNQIISFKNLLPEMTYTYQTSTDGINDVKCILWHGLLYDKKKYDCQLNIEIRPFGKDIIYAEIFHHIIDKPLYDINSWIPNIELDFKDAIKEIIGENKN